MAKKQSPQVRCECGMFIPRERRRVHYRGGSVSRNGCPRCDELAGNTVPHREGVPDPGRLCDRLGAVVSAACDAFFVSRGLPVGGWQDSDFDFRA